MKTAFASTKTAFASTLTGGAEVTALTRRARESADAARLQQAEDAAIATCEVRVVGDFMSFYWHGVMQASVDRRTIFGEPNSTPTISHCTVPAAAFERAARRRVEANQGARLLGAAEADYCAAPDPEQADLLARAERWQEEGRN